MTIPKCTPNKDTNSWVLYEGQNKSEEYLLGPYFNNLKEKIYPLFADVNPQDVYCKEGDQYFINTKAAPDISRVFDSPSQSGEPVSFAELVNLVGLPAAKRKVLEEIQKNFDPSKAETPFGPSLTITNKTKKLKDSCHQLRSEREAVSRIKDDTWGKFWMDFIIPAATFGFLTEQFTHAAGHLVSEAGIRRDLAVRDARYNELANTFNICNADGSKAQIAYTTPELFKKPVTVLIGSALAVVGYVAQLDYRARKEFDESLATESGLCDLKHPDMSTVVSQMSDEEVNANFKKWVQVDRDYDRALTEVNEKYVAYQEEYMNLTAQYSPSRISEKKHHEVTALMFTAGVIFFGAASLIARISITSTNWYQARMNRRAATDEGLARLQRDLKSGKVKACADATEAQKIAVEALKTAKVKGVTQVEVDSVEEGQVAPDVPSDPVEQAALARLNGVLNGSAESIEAASRISVGSPLGGAQGAAKVGGVVVVPAPVIPRSVAPVNVPLRTPKLVMP